MKRINKNIGKIIDFLATNNLNRRNIKKIFSWDSQSTRRGQIFISIKTKLSKKYQQDIHNNKMANYQIFG